jgi:hypothetical protein
MSTTTNRAKDSDQGKKLQKAAAGFRKIGPSVWQAVNELLTAIEYEDEVLADSAATALETALHNVLHQYLEKFIARSIGGSARITQMLDEVRAKMRGKCYNNHETDDIGRDLIKRIDHDLQQLKSAQGSAIKLCSHGFDIDGFEDLQFEIDATQALKEKFSNDWPWSSSRTASLDKEMAARSREAVERRDCKTIDEIISNLG